MTSTADRETKRIIQDADDLVVRQLKSWGIGSISLKAESRDAWQALLDHTEFVTVFYELFWHDYQVEYQRGRYVRVVPISRILTYGGRPIAVWPLSLCEDENGWSCQGVWNLVRSPLFRKDVPKRVRRKVVSAALEVLIDLKEEYSIPEIGLVHINWYSAEPSPFHRVCAERGYKTHVSYASVVDLDQGWEAIRKSMRKSYRHLVNVGEKHLDCAVIDTGNPQEDVFREFEALHLREAGRKTRPQDTWEMQWKSVQAGECFLTTVRRNAELVGGGLFSRSRSFCEYWVGAYRRDIPELPMIGHAVIGAAMKHMISLGLKLFFVGERHFPGDVWWPYGHPHDPKWLGISDFKAGFATRYAFAFFHYV